MKSTPLKSIFLAIAFFGILFSVNAQKNYDLNKNQKFSVFGTSTLHDWEMISSTGTGNANLTITNSKLEAINGITLTLLSESIKSGKSSMDKVAYKTLKTDKFKTIKYVLKTAEKVNETTWNLTGIYTIAGVSKEVRTQVKTTLTNGTVTLQGSNIIAFAEFGMDSPTALFGTIKTGEELTLKFTINFN
ncbi:YceI family protein [Flavobacterium frigoris]|uniref:Lipid/polyisoprenoid-binding YceI-like domain-containing protein n=1 Tax=Flavobacterium frigoris (strain PS1) TaxID=1086011 RepID=H7FQU4_FLAFP|nr:YceI family protein [Flavobacterium frigoris]EIA09081.1 hypothetical protein HJ01_01467 [Flavobacterium frigoris PS1]